MLLLLNQLSFVLQTKFKRTANSWLCNVKVKMLCCSVQHKDTLIDLKTCDGFGVPYAYIGGCKCVRLRYVNQWRVTTLVWGSCWFWIYALSRDQFWHGISFSEHFLHQGWRKTVAWLWEGEYNTWPFAAGIAVSVLISTVRADVRALSVSSIWMSSHVGKFVLKLWYCFPLI